MRLGYNWIGDWKLIAALGGTVVSLLAFVSTASADFSVCVAGAAAGQCDNPQGVAIDNETAHLYVADQGNNRVDVFESDGDFLFAFGGGVVDGVSSASQRCGPGAAPPTASCVRGTAGPGAGQFSEPSRIAVDNDAGSAFRHHAYVFDNDSLRIQRFNELGELQSPVIESNGECQLNRAGEPIAVGPGGVLFVADRTPGGSHRIEKFNPATGVCLGVVELFAGDFAMQSLAVDSSEHVYVTVDGAGLQIRKYELSGPARLCEAQLDPDTATTTLTVDGADRLFAIQQEVGVYQPIVFRALTEYDPGCVIQRRVGYGAIESNASGLAAFGGGAFLSEESGGAKFISPRPLGPIVIQGSPQAPAVSTSSTKAQLRAEVNPEGKETKYHFEYVDQEGFEDQGESFVGPATKITPEQVVPLTPSDQFQLHSAVAQIGCSNPITEVGEGKCLSPETTYHFRLITSNADGSDEAEGSTFITKPPFELAATFVTEVGADSARLGATLNPLGLPTTGFFEYVEDSSYQQSGFATATRSPVAGEIDFGQGVANITRAAAIAPLRPGTTYHYRIVVTDPLVEQLPGLERMFTTFAPLGVEPCPNRDFRTGAAAVLPDCRGYEMVSPLEKNNGDVIPLREGTTDLPGTLDQSSTTGTKLAYGAYRAFGDAKSGAFTSQYIASRDSIAGWLSHGISPLRERLDLDALAALDTEFKVFAPDLCTAWLRTVAEPPLAEGAVKGYSNLYRSHARECGTDSYDALTTQKPPNLSATEYFALELQGVSANGAAAIYVASDSLPVDIPPQPAPQLPSCVTKEKECQLRLYERTSAGLSLVCVLPSGVPIQSTKGCSAGTGAGDGGQSKRGNFSNAISADGSRVFWTAAASGPGSIYVRIDGSKTLAVSEAAEKLSGANVSQYWGAAEDGSAAIFTAQSVPPAISDLYRFEVDSATTTLIAHQVLGVLGASEDATYVYFASEEAIGGANAEGRAPIANQPNLYLEHDGEVRFIATLAAADINSLFDPVSVQPRFRVSRVTADGQHAAFMTTANPTGYDNVDANSGKADAEVYLYDATGNGGGGKLVCPSCNPSGGRPLGVDLNKGVGESWAAAQIPVWTNTLYASRVLSENGRRLFFEATDALTLGDTNGRQDVYQWEQNGMGLCSEGDSSFVHASNGCVNLISSGQSAQAVEFTDASPSGDDVFFSTLASLLPQDYGLVDIYDARVGGGFPTPPPPAGECEGENCQHPPAAPEETTPTSALYSGPEDLGKPKAKKSACPRGKVARKNRCVKHNNKKHVKQRRGQR